MCKAIKFKKVGIRASTPHMLSFFPSWYHFFFSIFASFLKLNIKSQINMDEHRHKILETLVFFMTIPN